MNASPVKLSSGAWGARVEGTVAVGDTVTIVTRGGKRWDAPVSRVVSASDGVTIVETVSDRPARPSRSGVSYGYSPVSGQSWHTNRRGRCEDAPCCGCCS